MSIKVSAAQRHELKVIREMLEDNIFSIQQHIEALGHNDKYVKLIDLMTRQEQAITNLLADKPIKCFVPDELHPEAISERAPQKPHLGCDLASLEVKRELYVPSHLNNLGHASKIAKNIENENEQTRFFADRSNSIHRITEAYVSVAQLAYKAIARALGEKPAIDPVSWRDRRNKTANRASLTV